MELQLIKSEWMRKYAAPALTGILLTLSQRTSLPINLGFMAWVALVPLLSAVRGVSQGERFVMGAVAGAAHFLTALYWMVGTLNTYGNLNIAGSFFVALLLVALETAYVVLFVLLLGLLIDRAERIPTVVAAPFLWIVIEFLRARTPFGGFPWVLLGYSQGSYTPLIQIADLTGVWGVTFLVVMVNGMFVDVIEWCTREKRPSPWGSVAAAVLLVVSSIIYGIWRMGEVERRNEAGKPLVAATVQGDVRQDVKWDERYESMILSRQIKLQREAVKAGAQFVVWPEAAMPFAFERDLTGVALANILVETGAYTLLGSVDYTFVNEEANFSNSAYLVGPNGIEGKYSKMHLVPFGEYIPLIKYLGFVDRLVKGAAGNFNAGTEAKVFRLPQGSFSVIICYEAIFGELVRRFRKEGAELLVNITNDAWFGDTSAPRQHLAMAAFRCVENHCWMVRTANTGISAVVDPLGRVVAQTPVFAEALLVEQVQFIPGATPYARWGDIFLYSILAVAVAGMTFIMVKNIKRSKDESGN